ncbi:MAG TPA: methylated-DNA--[protein]-cysteine S-methyltransferase [Candidatus Thalassarchaeaceae archaeon]|jgi:O-6-methylguanine DNA methyltransferase|nr:methylated-DNA--[protein]-cysteine S-methyltransferase [Candidatus Thalassarchaeaceae archaeon]|tara:strand:+ start:734 stop:1045 length:312 start_codon:yes stop_codon:yes gene_type:complete
MGEEVTIPELQGTDFQRMVWDEIRKIPLGETRTYKDIAVAIGNPGSSRAVANACARNPLSISVPCHRVTRSDGSIGGYSGPGGTSGKAVLLAVEKSLDNSRST